MTDENDGLALRLKTAQYGKQRMSFLRGQDSGRLIENQNVCRQINLLENFYPLLRTD